jgi:polyisoprenoid-binding protein YceI
MAMSRRARWIIAVVAAVLLVTVVAPFVYINLIRDDPPERLGLDDAPTTTNADGETDGASGEAIGDIAGTWQIADGSVVGYRVTEILFGQDAEAVGRAEGVTGEMTIEGTTVTDATFEVDMTTFESDESRRDGQFEGRIMEVDQFPTATFTLTEPIDLGGVPGEGDVVRVDAVGELTLHGVTREVTIPLSAELNGTSAAVNGSLTVTFSDYEIDDPSGGPASVGDEGELEVLLVFTR